MSPARAARAARSRDAVLHVPHEGPEPESHGNPLRAGTRLERIPEPCQIVIFGATGDLAHRKILPALYNLRRGGLLPPETGIVATARRGYTDAAFREEMRASVAEFSRNPVEPGIWNDFAANLHYQQGDFSDPAAYRALAERLFRGSLGTLPGLGREAAYVAQYLRVRDHLAVLPGDEAVFRVAQVTPEACALVREAQSALGS